MSWGIRMPFLSRFACSTAPSLLASRGLVAGVMRTSVFSSARHMGNAATHFAKAFPFAPVQRLSAPAVVAGRTALRTFRTLQTLVCTQQPTSASVAVHHTLHTNLFFFFFFLHASRRREFTCTLRRRPLALLARLRRMRAVCIGCMRTNCTLQTDAAHARAHHRTQSLFQTFS